MGPREDAETGWGTAGLTAAAILAFAASAIGVSFGPIRVDPLPGRRARARFRRRRLGHGFALWYAALRRLTAIRAALVQLSVPPLAAGAGVLLLGESLSPRLLVAGTLVLGGIALAVAGRRR